MHFSKAYVYTQNLHESYQKQLITTGHSYTINLVSVDYDCSLDNTILTGGFLNLAV